MKFRLEMIAVMLYEMLLWCWHDYASLVASSLHQEPQSMAKGLLFELDIHISVTAGTQEPKCLKLSGGRDEQRDDIGYPIKSLAEKTYRNRSCSALRPRHLGIQNVDTKGYPVNHTHGFTTPQLCPSAFMKPYDVFPETSSLLSSHR